MAAAGGTGADTQQGASSAPNTVTALLPDGSRLDVDVQLQPSTQQQAQEQRGGPVLTWSNPGQQGQGHLGHPASSSPFRKVPADHMDNTTQAASAGLLSTAGGFLGKGGVDCVFWCEMADSRAQPSCLCVGKGRW
jgi:hypothetical protein